MSVPLLFELRAGCEKCSDHGPRHADIVAFETIRLGVQSRQGSRAETTSVSPRMGAKALRLQEELGWGAAVIDRRSVAGSA